MQGKSHSPPAGQISREWLRRREIRATSFLHAFPDLMFLLRGDGTYVDFQPTKDIRPFVPPEEFIGKKVRDVLPEAVAVPAQYLISRALATGEMQYFEYVLPIDGLPRKYEARILPSQPDEVLAVVRDTTGPDRTLTADSQADADLRGVFEDCPDAVAAVNWETVIFANAALAQMFGYDAPASLKGRCVLDLISDEERLDLERRIHSRALGQRPLGTYRTRGRRCDAGIFPLEIHESEYWQNGRIYVLLRFRDLSLVKPVSGCTKRTSTDFKTARRGLDAYVVRINPHAAPILEAPPWRGQIPSAFGSNLTTREVQVLMLIAIGQSTKEVAASLGIAYKTADAHRTHIMEKLGVHETASIVRYAIRAGLVEP